jgi:uncharacterized protein YndB with AHSA1/START domain
MRTERHTVIDAPASDVFAYIADITRHPEWAGNPLEIRPTSAGPLAVGSTWESTGHRMGTHVDRVTVTELEPGRRFSHESKGDLGRWRTTFVLEPGGDRTTLRRGMESLELSRFARMLSPMILFFNGGEMTKNLRRIKSNVEAGSRQVTTR